MSKLTHRRVRKHKARTHRRRIRGGNVEPEQFQPADPEAEEPSPEAEPEAEPESEPEAEDTRSPEPVESKPENKCDDCKTHAFGFDMNKLNPLSYLGGKKHKGGSGHVVGFTFKPDLAKTAGLVGGRKTHKRHYKKHKSRKTKKRSKKHHKKHNKKSHRK